MCPMQGSALVPGKRLLIIAEYFAPVNTVASIRWTKIAKYLSIEHGYEIDVLTNEKDFKGTSPGIAQYEYDSTLEYDMKYVHRFIYIPTSLRNHFINSLFHAAKRTYRKTKASRLRSAATNPSKNNSDSHDALRSRIHQIKASLQRVRERLAQTGTKRAALAMKMDWSKYDVVISSYGPRWTHLIGACAKKEHPQHIWIADFRDSPRALEGEHAKITESMFEKITRQADCVFTVAAGGLAVLPVPKSQRIEVVYNGFDPVEGSFRNRTSNDLFTLVYTGTLYRDGEKRSDLSPVFQVIEELEFEKAIDPDRVRVIYAGNSSDQFVDQVSSFPSIKWECLGLVSRQESMQLQDAAAVLLLCIWNTPAQQGCVTGKVFEYLTSGAPIACVCSGNVPESELKWIIETANAGICYEEAAGQEDYATLKKFVKLRYDEWIAKGITACDVKWDFIDQFSHKRIAGKVNDIIDSIKSKEQGE